ncbi:MAG: NAD(+)/NADH kinase [Treponemataceae bacterium]|nr:MAG: NAD(+)/NADH kinase [Treponemataceae bacterium]
MSSSFFPKTKSVPIFRRLIFASLWGGDGTVLFAALKCAPLKIPVFPVNFGEFGFIANIQKDTWQSELDIFLAGKSVLTSRSMLEMWLYRDGKEAAHSLALNDAVLCSRMGAHIITTDIACGVGSADNIGNDLHALPQNRLKPLGTFKSDGIIVSSATGSTAYSLAAGGPIIDPSIDAIVLTPVCAFSLSSRPLVLASETVLLITLQDSGIALLADGQELGGTCSKGESIIIKRAEHTVKLAGSTSESFYAALRSKMNWSGGHGDTGIPN